MRTVSRLLTATLLASGLVAVPVLAKDKPAAAAAVAPGAVNPKDISKVGRVAIVGAQKLETAGDAAGTLAAVKAAEAAGGLNPTDTFYLAQIKLGAANKLKDNVALEEAIKTCLDSPFLPAAERPKYIRNLVILSQNRRDYVTATRYSEELVAMSPNDPDTVLNLAILYSDQGQAQKAIQTFDKAIAAKVATGQPAPEVWYRKSLGLAYDKKLAAETARGGAQLVAAYPTTANWNLVLNIARDALSTDDQYNLDAFRLMRAANALGPEREYQEYAGLAIEKGLPGEAKKVLDDGIVAKKIGSKPIDKELMASANKNVPADKAGLPALERDAPKAPNGKAALATGDAFYSYGNYAKAADMYRLAISKAGGVDVNIANLRLGASLAQSGDKAGAATAFQSVTGPRQALAAYWMAYLGQKTA